MTEDQRLYFLVFSADGGGGIARTVSNLANRLAERHPVELISLYRQRQRPFFPLDERIAVTHLHDARPLGPEGNRIDGQVRAREVPDQRGRLRAFLDKRPSRLAPAEAAPDISLLTDLLLRRKLRSLPPGILISTRPSLHVAAARFAPGGVTTIGQEHLNLSSRAATPVTERVILDSARRLDCLVTLTPGDRDDYAEALTGAGTTVEAIPNAVPWSLGPAATLDSKVVVSVGRLGARKGFPRLIKAYDPVARDHPDWQLHIYGKGPERDALARLIAERGLEGQVILQGQTDRVDEVLAGASLFAFGSLSEGFGMALVEAMSKGLPVVSYDVPRGPSDLIEDGANGRLIPDGDRAGFTAALRQLVEDDGLRSRMGAAALDMAKAYDIDTVADRWEQLFDRLAAG